MPNAQEALQRFQHEMKLKGYEESEIDDMLYDCAAVFAYIKISNLGPSKRTVDILRFVSSEIDRSLN